MRFFMFDRIEEIKYGDYIKGVKCITLADDVFDEHFPGYPVFPGSLMLESLAQIAGSLFELTMRNESKPILRSVLSIVNRMKYKNKIVPGDKVILTATITGRKPDAGTARVKAEVDGIICTTGELTFTFHDISSPEIEDQRELLYKIGMKNTKVIE